MIFCTKTIGLIKSLTLRITFIMMIKSKDSNNYFDIIKDGVSIFTYFADRYGDKIYDNCKAEEFFKDFIEMTRGQVILDFLDADNDDRIERFSFDETKEFLKIYTRIPENDPEARQMRKMVFPYDIYSLLVRFKNVSFIRIRNHECVAIVVNGYTMQKKQIEKYVQESGAMKVCDDEKESFFTSDWVCKKYGFYEFMRAMTTPISSFWILPKQLHLSAQDSKRFLYLYNIETLDGQMNDAVEHLHKQLGKSQDKEDKDKTIMMYGNQLRVVAEALFKLVVCFYHKKYDFKGKDTEYNDRLLGDLIGSLKKHVYQSEKDKERFGVIVRNANKLSHDSGQPVTIQDFQNLHTSLEYYLEDFKNKVNILDVKEKMPTSAKPSPQNFIEQNLKSWDFSLQIKDIDKASTSNCAFLLKIKPCFAPTNLFAEEDDYLCKDGKIRTLKEEDLTNALVIPNRETLIKLEERIDDSIKEKCDEAGFDTEGSIVGISETYIQCGKPAHLFTLDEITQLMREANDGENNKLVIDENGCARLIHNPRQGNLYPVSIETWCAGKRYAGKDSSLSDAEPSYLLCLDLWLRFLQTKRPQYGDYHKDVDTKKIIGSIMEILGNEGNKH